MKSINILLYSLYIAFFLIACEKQISLEVLIKQKAFDNHLDEKDIIDLQKKTGLSCGDLMDSINTVFGKSSKVLPDIAPCDEVFEKGSFAKDYNLNLSTNFYIENSASMLGYFNNNSEFRASLLFLSAFFKEKNSKVFYHYINENIFSIDENQETFIKALATENAQKYGNLNYSGLDEMLKKIMLKVNHEKSTLAIFASDFIYDVKSKSPENEQLNIEYKIRDIFADAGKKYKKSILVLRMQSNFSGTYFDYKDVKILLKNQMRPYYIWFIGDEKYIDYLNLNFNFNDLKGYKERYLFSTKNEIKNTYISILPNSTKEGHFKRDNANISANTVLAINHLKVDNKTKKISLKVALDLSKMPFEKQYLLDLKNYKIESSVSNSILKIETLNKENINKNDYRFLSTATHILTFQIESLPSTLDSLKINLLFNYPKWEQYSSLNDADIKTQLNNTFGLAAIMYGLQAAFKNSNSIDKNYAVWGLVLKP